MELPSIGLAFLAGLVSILSPCVLPLLPVVLSTAVAEHKFGPVALAAGLALSFFALGMFIATIGFSMGVDSEVFRMAAAALLLLVGAVLIVPVLQARLSLASAPFASWAEDRFGAVGTGWPGSSALASCSGPCGRLASVRRWAPPPFLRQGRDLLWVSLTMLVFAIGTVLPLILVGLLSRGALIRWRGKLMVTGAMAKSILGLGLISMGILILTGQDRAFMAALLAMTPEWLMGISQRF